MVQEGFPEDIPFEPHLSDVTRERGGDLRVERSGKLRTTAVKALRWECTWLWDVRSTPGGSIVSRAERRRG